MPKAIFYGCHGNTKIHMLAKFYHNAFYGLRSEEVFLGPKCPGHFFVHGCDANTELHMHTKFHFHAFHDM